jgi:hypothetical protein
MNSRLLPVRIPARPDCIADRSATGDQRGVTLWQLQHFRDAIARRDLEIGNAAEMLPPRVPSPLPLRDGRASHRERSWFPAVDSRW